MEDIVVNSVDLFTVWGMRLLSAIMILVGGYLAGNWADKAVHKIDKLEATLQTFLGGMVRYITFTVSIVIILGQLGVQTASLLAVMGAAGLAIGLALQGTLSNVAAGVMLLILRPFNVGDYIKFGSISGTVKSLSLFGSELATSDNVYVFAPNSSIWNSDIYNYSRNKQRRHDLIIGISYGDDINKAFKTIGKVLDNDGRIVTTKGKEPIIVVTNLGDSSVDIKVRFWTASSDYWKAQWDLIKGIKEALDKGGISIPFPTRSIEMINTAEEVKIGKKQAA